MIPQGAYAAGVSFSASKRGEKTAGGGISISLPLHPLLKNDQSGGLATPPIGCTPRGGRLRHLAGAAGPLRSKVPPPVSPRQNSLGEIPKMGEPQFPLFGRF